MSIHQRLSVVSAGLALFSMFFGAGDLIWPLLLGGQSGDQNFYALIGLLVTSVGLPFLGLTAMMLFDGDYHAFFRQIGRIPSILIIFSIQAILGPFGSIPRLFNLSYINLKPYMPEILTLPVFSALSIGILLLFTIKKQRVIDILGLVLTPILLLSLGSILLFGMFNHPDPLPTDLEPTRAFLNGLSHGYFTLDLVASFIFAPLVLSHFILDDMRISTKAMRTKAFKNMTKASLIAVLLLSVMYIGLTYTASWYTPALQMEHEPAERFSLIAQHILGHYGGPIASIAVAMACLTTAIPLTAICSDYIREDILHGKTGIFVPLIITLVFSALVANFGFTEIDDFLAPVLQSLCPAFIVLSVFNILHKIFETPVPKLPVYATFLISTSSYLL